MWLFYLAVMLLINSSKRKQGRNQLDALGVKYHKLAKKRGLQVTVLGIT